MEDKRQNFAKVTTCAKLPLDHFGQRGLVGENLQMTAVSPKQPLIHPAEKGICEPHFKGCCNAGALSGIV
ncbi:hypothetical protein DS909_17190 [Phaeobacter gallaeciensis]|uniref:Uncharacterized protein n=1 Tax=Phaeobacter gallaeciensis TaxID=60890 RepID=A0A366WSH1_9RHOB|nr:hypothetical protein DS909_17190 [Phaeobacter gallaeciensis]